MLETLLICYSISKSSHTDDVFQQMATLICFTIAMLHNLYLESEVFLDHCWHLNEKLHNCNISTVTENKSEAEKLSLNQLKHALSTHTAMIPCFRRNGLCH